MSLTRRALFAAPLLALAACTSGFDPALLEASGDQAVNRLRADKGLPALRRDTGLARAAQQQADAMAAKETMSHAAGGAFAGRVRRFYDGQYFAENIAAGQRDLGGAVASWIQSPPHRRNMLNAKMRAYGIASAKSASGKRYWAMVLAG
ncbi:CAP domain-containing protein [Notoacmeibacter sp. MSK16QG-6]|uniref:CAP domain-containing protein n=1 Tax=Notoacmeibacter sp. MSK16QG-6 TaxID=2957982 RepID=UPI00209D214C|nr:CAP domain-containing protein [Notoacmeibacter sp. MSK16QG-6]MCP1199428.1 CAP domain-containing protein [Notoacmeibacter sp. MSK16QG-6]